MNNVCVLIYKANDGNAEKIKTLEKQIQEIDTKVSEEEYNTQLIKITNLPKQYDLATELGMIHKNILALKDKYGDEFNYNNIEQASGTILERALTVGSVGGGTSCAHPWSNAICQAGVTATAVLAGAACSAGTGGLGVVPCIAAVTAIQIAGLDACYHTYCLEAN